LPFPILGFDTDNGGEFLNWHLVDYFGKRARPVGFTRSRAYRKNDNARVEQKNWTHVRQLVGYGRLEGALVAELLDDLYRNEWGWFRNFFCPVMQTPAHRDQRQPQTAHLRPACHSLCSAQSFSEGGSGPDRQVEKILCHPRSL
jgi:hypothetical protein